MRVQQVLQFPAIEPGTLKCYFLGFLYPPSPSTKIKFERQLTKMELDKENIRIVWTAGNNWVIKRKNHQYFHRLEREYGEWTPGLPPEAIQAEIDILFDE
jgi:hypothetical protein